MSVDSPPMVVRRDRPTVQTDVWCFGASVSPAEEGV
jgi:hypothetical protein